MMTSTLTSVCICGDGMAQLWHGIDTYDRFAPKPARARKTCGRKATGKVLQRGRSVVRLELWQISTIMGPTDSWNWAYSSSTKACCCRLEPNHVVAESYAGYFGCWPDAVGLHAGHAF